jgi:hypothetical protein
MKTTELTGIALDWAVAKCADLPFPIVYDEDGRKVLVSPSTNWAQGGPIIEREMIDLKCLPTKQGGFIWRTACADGPTPLIAAMRCYVASKLGDEVEIPEELNV